MKEEPEGARNGPTQSRTNAEEKKAIESLVREINKAWLQRDFDRLRRRFHPQIVMVAPGFDERVSGVDACVKSFEDFLANAEVRDFEESEVTVDCRGSAAVATFRFETSYRMDERNYEESGREIWVFARDQEGWRAIWRTQVPIGRKG